MEKIKRSELVYAKNYIDGHTPYTVEKQQYDSWLRNLKRTVCYGLVQKYRELLQNVRPEWNYQARYENQNGGDSILHAACINGRKALIEYLLENGWKDSINKKNKLGNTPFFLAVLFRVMNNSNSIEDLIPIFLERNANIFEKNHQNQNILQFVQEKAPNSPILLELKKLFREKGTDRALTNYLFYTYYTKNGKKSKISHLPCCYKMEMIKFF